jgi:hypothetical protein
MFGMFLWWTALLVVLGMLVGAPLPGRLRAFGLFALAATAWLLWGLYGAEYLADVKWPEKTVEAQCTDSEKQTKDGNAPLEKKDGPTARLGQVGDLFGGVNALFAALAFAGVGIAAYQQWKSTQIAFKQSIETTFFSALELHHRIIDGLKFDRDRVLPAKYDDVKRMLVLSGRPEPDRQPAAYGREVFAEVLRGISYVSTGPSTYKTTIDNYELLQTEHNYVLGHYFRNLYQILKLIDRDEALDPGGKQKYASVLRAQLSSDELAVLMVNCAGTMVDRGEFRVLLVRYRMLEHAPLKKDASDYLHAGMKQRVVLADEGAMKQYTAEPQVPAKPGRYQGAFGSNPAV